MLEQDQSRRVRRVNPISSQKEDVGKSKSNIAKRRNAISRRKMPTQFRQDVYERFHQFNMAQSFIKVQKMFHSLIGRHSVIDYSKQFGFKQQWEVVNKQQFKEQYRTALPYALLNVVLLLVMNCCLWGISAQMTFQINQIGWMYFIIISVCVVEIAKNVPKLLTLPLKLKFISISKQLICILISITILVVNTTNVVQKILLQFVVLVLIYLKTRKLYDHVKIFHISSKHRQIVDIIDLFVLLIAISHIFALILYATTHLHPDTNWMTKIGMEDHSWITKYIYALYFSCTTLLTVGYGDISPTNVAQILTILLTQLIGIATFAYAVNKIGVALTNITQRTQRLQKDLGNVEYIGNAYQLKPQLVCRMRTQLIKDQTLQSQLNIKEESELFSRFSQDLREKISIQSSMRVIKRSMFMIGNWTGKLQSKIARKLIKQIYAIDQFLPQHPGKQKIYIIDKGKIDVINNARCGFKICFQKVLKTISVQSNNEVVVENVYGYSAVISERTINLNAVAKSNSICYSLQKSDLFQLLHQCQQDLEHFHQLKSKINLSRNPQETQAPSIRNFREHYCPSVHFIIAQYSYKAGKNKFNQINERISAIRSNRRTKISCSAEDMSSKTLGSLPRNDKINKSCFYFQSTLVGRMNDTLDELKCEQQTKKTLPVKDIALNFEACRDYQRYYKKFNYQTVVNRMKTKLNPIRSIGKNVNKNPHP